MKYIEYVSIILSKADGMTFSTLNKYMYQVEQLGWASPAPCTPL